MTDIIPTGRSVVQYTPSINFHHDQFLWVLLSFQKETWSQKSERNSTRKVRRRFKRCNSFSCRSSHQYTENLQETKWRILNENCRSNKDQGSNLLTTGAKVPFKSLFQGNQILWNLLYYHQANQSADIRLSLKLSHQHCYHQPTYRRRPPTNTTPITITDQLCTLQYLCIKSARRCTDRGHLYRYRHSNLTKIINFILLALLYDLSNAQ